MSERIPAREFGPVSTEKMKTMAAILQDPNPIHWDVEAVKQLGMGHRQVNQGPINMSYLVNTLISWTGSPVQEINMSYLVNTLISWTGDPGALRELVIRYQSNVFAGDVVRCEGTVDETHGDVAVCSVTAAVGDLPVITGKATVHVPRRT